MKKSTKWIRFLGSRNLIFTLVTIILAALAILLVSQLDFVFYPIVVILSNILIPFVVAILLYYLFEPVVNFFEKYNLPRVVTISALYIILLLLIIWGLSAALPALAEQVESFITAFPSYIESISNEVRPWFEQFASTDEFTQLYDRIENFLGELPERLVQFVQSSISGISSVVAGVTNVVVATVFVPIILFFLLKDDEEFFNTILSVLPPGWRVNFIRVMNEMNNQAGSYVKGQLIIAVATALMTYIGFLIIGMNYAGILGFLTGVTSIIPYIGPTISFIPALIIAAFDSWWMVFKLLIVWMVVQFVEGNIIQPNIMGQQLSIHPLTIIVILFVAGDIAGLFGLIFGVPIYAIVKVFVVYWFEQFKKRYNKYYGENENIYDEKLIRQGLDDSKDRGLEKYKQEARELEVKENKKMSEQSEKPKKNIFKKIIEKIKNSEDR